MALCWVNYWSPLPCSSQTFCFFVRDSNRRIWTCAQCEFETPPLVLPRLSLRVLNISNSTLSVLTFQVIILHHLLGHHLRRLIMKIVFIMLLVWATHILCCLQVVLQNTESCILLIALSFGSFVFFACLRLKITLLPAFLVLVLGHFLSHCFEFVSLSVYPKRRQSF